MTVSTSPAESSALTPSAIEVDALESIPVLGNAGVHSSVCQPTTDRQSGNPGSNSPWLEAQMTKTAIKAVFVNCDPSGSLPATRRVAFRQGPNEPRFESSSREGQKIQKPP